jgi:hypothetical protein
LPCLNSLTFLANISVSSSLPHLGLGFGAADLELTAATLDFFISLYKMHNLNHIYFLWMWEDISSDSLDERQYTAAILSQAYFNTTCCSFIIIVVKRRNKLNNPDCKKILY